MNATDDEETKKESTEVPAGGRVLHGVLEADHRRDGIAGGGMMTMMTIGMVIEIGSAEEIGMMILMILVLRGGGGMIESVIMIPVAGAGRKCTEICVEFMVTK